MELEVLQRDGKKSGKKVKLPEKVFGIEPKPHAVYLAIKVLNANARQGTVGTKNRAAVRGGGKKPWKQKGRGVARAGSNRSPLWVGGGRVFGPQPRDYSQKIPKKVMKAAKASIYSDKARRNEIVLIEDFKLDNPKTKEIAAVLRAIGVEEQKTLLLLPEKDPIMVRAGRNIPKLKMRVAATESAYDLLDCERILIQEGALDNLVKVY